MQRPPTLPGSPGSRGAPGGVGRAGQGGRDPRLDLFRGLAMLIILMAHVPWNYWAEFIPARWGPSDAAEMFVFCSGYAAALAFGGTFLRAGFVVGTARILLRCWQLYWAQVALVVAVAGLSLLADRHWPRTALADVWNPGVPYLATIGLGPLELDLAVALPGLLTLGWVPNYFDILPMYVVVLLMVPMAMALARVDARLPVAAALGLYAATRLLDLDLQADPWTGRPWFFDPFAWQLLFFTGFSLARGWIVPPPFERRLALLAGAWVIVLVPICQHRFHAVFPVLADVHDWLLPADSKTYLSPVRYLHFLALAYLCLGLLQRYPSLATSAWVRPVLVVGQQALPVFLLSMVLAWGGGIVLDHLGRTAGPLALVNVAAITTVVGAAYLCRWLKAEPWARRPVPAA